MRFKSIEIKNYRQYKNLDFKFYKNKETDLHVIIGQNGIGKTNILNAITWCLYGTEPHLGNKSKSLPKLNLESKKEAEKNKIDIVGIEVKIYTEDNDKSIIFHRKQDIRVDTGFENKCEFIVEVLDCEKNSKFYQKNEAKEYVNRYMPEKIREYFYFDGEQLYNYFLAKNDFKIKESVYAISQVDILTRMSERMNKIIYKKQKDAGKNSPDVKKINSNIDNIRTKITKTEETIFELNNQIALSERIIKDNSSQLRGQDNLPELEERYQKLRLKLTDCENEKNKVIKELKQFIVEYKIVLAFYPYAKETLKIILEKENNKALPPNIDKKLLEKMLREHKCAICNHELNLKEENNIKDILYEIKVSSETSHLLLNIKSELERIVNEGKCYLEKKENLLKRSKKAELDLIEVEKELQKIDNRINKFTDADKIKHLHVERDSHMKLVRLNNQKLGSEKSQLKNLKHKLELEEKELVLAISKIEECEKLQKIIKFSKASKKIIETIETEMMNEVKQKMEKRTSEYFSRLVWKKNTYEKIELDENYNLDLIHKDGYSCVGSCSAAESSLLALSFTLALHEVSGFNSLLFIDTPVARVSDDNRVNFANVLNEVSKRKQIIMTLSPDEYSQDIKNIFKHTLSNELVLNTNDEKYTYFEVED